MGPTAAESGSAIYQLGAPAAVVAFLLAIVVVASVTLNLFTAWRWIESVYHRATRADFVHNVGMHTLSQLTRRVLSDEYRYLPWDLTTNETFIGPSQGPQLVHAHQS